MDEREWDDKVEQLISMPIGTQFEYKVGEGYGAPKIFKCKTIKINTKEVYYKVTSCSDDGVYTYEYMLSSYTHFTQAYADNIEYITIINQGSIKNFLTKVRESV